MRVRGRHQVGERQQGQIAQPVEIGGGGRADRPAAYGLALHRRLQERHHLGPGLALRAAGHAATEFTAQGRDGTVTVVNAIVARKDVAKVQALIHTTDPAAFVTLDEARPLNRGYFRH